jgi:hypothetical protein
MIRLEEKPSRNGIVANVMNVRVRKTDANFLKEWLLSDRSLRVQKLRLCALDIN